MGYKYSNLVTKTKSGEVVDLSDMKDHLNVDSDYYDDDTIIQQKINQAISYVEDYIGQDVLYTLNSKEYFEFKGDFLSISEAPYISTVSITVGEGDDEEELVEGDDFSVQTKRTEFIIRFNDKVDTPKLTVSFYTGFAQDDVPLALKSAIMIVANDLYDMYRTSTTVGVSYNTNNAANNLMNNYRINRW
jgi:uncharacterized phiE125 gp8 family phage protein